MPADARTIDPSQDDPTDARPPEPDTRETEDFLQGLWPGDHWIGWHTGDLMENAEVYARIENVGGVARVTALFIKGHRLEPITARDLRRLAVTTIENAESLVGSDAELEALKARPPLRRQPGENPAEFSQRVADYYQAWGRLTPNPAAAMVAEYGVKSSTLHQWIHEARLRGLLPPPGQR